MNSKQYRINHEAEREARHAVPVIAWTLLAVAVCLCVLAVLVITYH